MANQGESAALRDTARDLDNRGIGSEKIKPMKKRHEEANETIRMPPRLSTREKTVERQSWEGRVRAGDQGGGGGESPNQANPELQWWERSGRGHQNNLERGEQGKVGAKSVGRSDPKSRKNE